MGELLVLVIAAAAVYAIYKVLKIFYLQGYHTKDLIKSKQPNTKIKLSASSFRDNPYTSTSKTTLEAQALFYALKDRGIPVELEKFDGYKTIDISIPSARINIEVDGTHHNTNSMQALADLKRTYYSFLEGYYTLRIPNSLLRSNLEQTTQYIAEMCSKSYEVQLRDR